MPTFEFTSPEGKNYSVDGPEGATSAQAFQMLQQHLGTAPDIGTGEDIAKTALPSVGRMVAGTAGAPGDLSNLLAKGSQVASDYIASKLGIDPGPRASGPVLPTSAGIERAIEPYTGNYQPQTFGGKVFDKAVQFAPGLIGGPETALMKGLTRVAAPAVAGQVGEEVGGPIGGVVGALAGATGASKVAQFKAAAKAASQAAKAIPEGEQLVKLGSNQFDQARDMKMVVKPDFAANTAADMRTALKDFDPEDASVKDVFRKIDRLDNLASSSPGLPPTAVEMNDIENVRKQLSKLRMSPDGSTREAAKQAQAVLTKNQMALTPSDVISGDAPLYSRTLQDAVGNYGAGKRSAAVTGKMDLADLNTNTAGSGANGDNAMRQALKQLARPMNNTNVPVAKKLGFNNPEIDAIKRAATGTMLGNTARYIGKAAPTGIVSASLGADLVGGPVAGLAVPAVGYLAKKIGDLSTRRAASALDSLVRSRSPLAAQVAAQLPPQIVQQLPAKTTRLLRAMILADPSLKKINDQISQQPSQTPAY